MDATIWKLALTLGLAAACGGSDAESIPDAEPGGGTPDAAPVPQQFYWVDWTAATAGAAGTADGSIDAPSGQVAVSYAGEISFAQTDGGTNYWAPPEPYVNHVTANAPDVADIIAMVGPSAGNRLTFEPAVSGLVMGIVSLGQPAANVKYTFDVDIDLLSFGAGFWGNGVIEVEGTNTISGSEGHGAIQFAGSISEVTWEVVNGESWHGFTVGIPAQ